MTRAELKSAAKQQIKGNVGKYFLCWLIVIAISAGVSFIPFAGPFVNIFFMAPVTFGFAMLHLGMTRNEEVSVSGLFKGFEKFGTAIFLNILIGFFTFLWSLLLVIPGIIKGLSYSMSYLVLADNPDMTAREALNESKEIMKGHKWDLFVLYLSFILWDLLGLVTIGLAYIYVGPYKNVTIANFYNTIKVQSSVDGYTEGQTEE